MSSPDDGARAEALTLSGLARARLFFNRADFWGCLDALSEAWPHASPGERDLLRGLCQSATAFHKYLVHANRVTAQRLLQRALHRLEPYSDGHGGIALDAFRSELRRWSYRLGEITPDTGTVHGLPRIEWTSGALAGRLAVDRVRLYRIEDEPHRCVLVEVEAGGLTGWGECRLAWGAHGVWDSLTDGLVPALLAEPMRSPVELPLRWSGVSESPQASAGLEAAVWDAWARMRGWPLVTALGASRRSVPLLGRATAADSEALGEEIDRLIAAGYRGLMVPARPNADRRVVPGLVGGLEAEVALDLGGEYRLADMPVLTALDDLGPSMLVQPVPTWNLEGAARLRQCVSAPVSMGGWRFAEEVRAASGLGALDLVELDPGLCGLSESVRIAAWAYKTGVGLWVRSTAATPIGAAADLAMACHSGVSRPCYLGRARMPDGSSTVAPDGDGAATFHSDLGLGVAPDQDWLKLATVRHAVVKA